MIGFGRCHVDVAVDYKKRSNVLRIRTGNEGEYLLQADDAADMEQWRLILAETEDKEGQIRSRSPTGQSPVSKARKASQPATGRSKISNVDLAARMAICSSRAYSINLSIYLPEKFQYLLRHFELQSLFVCLPTFLRHNRSQIDSIS